MFKGFRRWVVLFFALVLCFAVLCGCGNDSNGKDPNGDDNPNGPTLLRDVYDEYFPVGAAFAYGNYNQYAEGENLVKHFSSLTCENEMKWSSVQPTKGSFSFTKAKQMVEFAKENDMKVRGHALVWHNQVPNWVTSSGDKQKILTNIEEHIERVVTEFGDDIYAWDVVNEALSDDMGVTYRQSDFYNACGIDYIKTAFRKAREVNPNIKLFYNDYNLDMESKRVKALTLIKALQDDGVPIDGIGMQGHYNVADFNLQSFKASVDAYLAKGLEVQITELDISIYGYSNRENKSELNEQDDAMQAAIYREIFKYFREKKKAGEKITGITLWGVADDYTWLHNYPVRGRNNYPLLFDENHKKKSAYYSIVNFDGVTREEPILG